MEYRREVFWCGPDRIAFDHLRPREYFGFLQSMFPRFDAAALPAHLAAFGLESVAKKRLSELSTGTQRKVWLSAALVVGTRVVLLDEPLNALDKNSLSYMLQQLEVCAADRQRAWIVASHASLGDAGAAATSVIDLVPPAAG